MNQDQIEKHSTAQSTHIAFTPRNPGRMFLLPRPKASCQNGVSFIFCPIFGIRLYSCSL